MFSRGNSKAEIALNFLPETGFPTVDIQLIRIERCNRHRSIGANDLIRRHIIRAQVEATFPCFSGFSQSIHRETQVRQYVVIDNIVKKDSIRIE